MDSFQMAYTVLGGLGIFFLGLKFLSESLQALSGDIIRKVINWLTTNRILAVLVGALVTMIVQSSSITTVMVVGMVNAGLMNLAQAIGVIFGANVGTTVTGWIIAINVGKYGLLFVALGAFPMFFVQKENWKEVGKLLVALGFVFIGIKTMGSAFKPLRTDPTFLSLLQYFTASNYLSLLGCILIGCVLTCIVQSSSAMLGITIALAMTGAITFETSMGLVLGQNIGTTITALLASIGTNVNAKRAARAHAFFNIFGALVMTLIFWKYLDFVRGIFGGDPNFIDANGGRPYIAKYIAAGHSIFNITATILFLPLLGWLAKFVTLITPGDEEKEKTRLIPFAATSMAPTIGLESAQKELEHMMDKLKVLLDNTKTYVNLIKDDPKLHDSIVSMEDEFDVDQKDLTVYVCNVMESPLTPDQSSLGYSLIRSSDEIESVSDYCDTLAKIYKKTLTKKDRALSENARQEFAELMNEVIAYFDTVREFSLNPKPNLLDEYLLKSKQIAHHAERVRKSHLDRIKTGECTPLSGLAFSDMILSANRIKNHTVNILEAMASGVLQYKAAS